MKNIKIINGELNNWKNDDCDYYYPVAYILWFNFHDEEVTAYFTTDELKKSLSGNKVLDCCSAETSSDLLNSFLDKLEDDDVANEICKYCESIWENAYENEGIYNYLGEKEEIK